VISGEDADAAHIATSPASASSPARSLADSPAVICGLGNPGSEYADTRHNVGFWVLDRLQHAWRFPAFRREKNLLVTQGTRANRRITLIKPLTYMNRSGAAIAPLLRNPEFNPAEQLLIIVDDVALPVGRVRMRARGSAGGHNGLKSIEATLQSRDYARLRIGVGTAPPDADTSEWVLSEFDKADEESVIGLLDDVVHGVETWVEHGADAAMMRLNRIGRT